jgi:thymidylate synthase
MENYNNLIRDILDNGIDKPDRTGIGSRSVFGRMLRWDLADSFPLQTTRRVPLRIAFEETMFFLRGETNTKLLEDKNINIWKGNTSREFLDSRGLAHLPEGSIGAGYSHQWRNFGGDIGVSNGVDQIKLLLDGLKNDPGSRRHIVTGWNPQQLSETPLPPCHITNMYSVIDKTLNSSFVMRSNDVPFGLPFNIASYALLNHIFAKYLGMAPGELVYFGWDVHIYQNQMDMVREILERKPRSLPTLNINKDLNTLSDILALQWEDIELLNYDPYPDVKNKPGMAV